MNKQLFFDSLFLFSCIVAILYWVGLSLPASATTALVIAV